jgi:hypothetical protein
MLIRTSSQITLLIDQLYRLAVGFLEHCCVIYSVHWPNQTGVAAGSASAFTDGIALGHFPPL